jgi:hypothetical protein
MLQPDPSLAAQALNAYVPYAQDADFFERNALAVAGAIRIGSWLIPGAGPIIGLTVNAVGSGYERSLDGQSLQQSIWGGAADATGYSQLYGAIYLQDWATQRPLNWTTGQRWFNGIFGGIQYLGRVAAVLGRISQLAGPLAASGLSAAALSLSRLNQQGNQLLLSGMANWAPSLAAAGQAAGAFGASGAA